MDESGIGCDRISDCDEEPNNTTRDIYFGLMLSYPDPQQRVSFVGAFDDGHDIAPAAYLAVEQINNRSDILQDYSIKLIRADGGCYVTERSAVGINEICCSCKPIVGIIGPSCGTASMIVSQLAGHQQFSLVTIHYGQREILGNRTLFPFAFGILGTHAVYLEAMVKLVKHNSWTKFAILFSEDDIDIARSRRIQESVSKELPNFEISFTSAIYDNNIPLSEVKDTFTRVILVLGTPGITLRTICLARYENMVYPNYQWVFMERIDIDFHNVTFLFNGDYYSCSDSEISDALYGSIDLLFGAVDEDDDAEAVADNGITPQQYKQEYAQYVEKYKTRFNVASDEVDWAMGFYYAVWSLAYAVNDSLEEMDMDLTQVKPGSRILAQTITNHMAELDFWGISGRIRFDNKTGFNLATTVNVYQYNQDMTSRMVGMYVGNALTLFMKANPNFISAEFDSRHEHISITVTVILLVITVLITPLAIFLQVISIIYRDYKPIKASSPRLNHLIFCGCYLVEVGAVVYVLTESHDATTSIAKVYLCNVIPGFLTTGASLMLGTIFVKTWRLHRIYTHLKRLKNTSISYASNKLLGAVVIVLFSVDVIICIVWVLVDRLKIYQTKEIQLMEGEQLPVVFINNNCSSEFTTYWLILLLAPKVALTLCSFFFALLTRFRMKEFRTRNVIVLVYLITILSGLMLPIYLIITFLDVEVTIRVVILYLFLDIVVYICICLLFLSPTYALIKAGYLSRQQRGSQGSQLFTH